MGISFTYAIFTSRAALPPNESPTFLNRSVLCAASAASAFINSPLRAGSSSCTETMVVKLTDRTPLSVITFTNGIEIASCALPWA